MDLSSSSAGPDPGACPANPQSAIGNPQSSGACCSPWHRRPPAPSPSPLSRIQPASGSTYWPSPALPTRRSGWGATARESLCCARALRAGSSCGTRATPPSTPSRGTSCTPSGSGPRGRSGTARSATAGGCRPTAARPGRTGSSNSSALNGSTSRPTASSPAATPSTSAPRTGSSSPGTAVRPGPRSPIRPVRRRPRASGDEFATSTCWHSPRAGTAPSGPLICAAWRARATAVVPGASSRYRLACAPWRPIPVALCGWGPSGACTDWIRDLAHRPPLRCAERGGQGAWPGSIRRGGRRAPWPRW